MTDREWETASNVRGFSILKHILLEKIDGRIQTTLVARDREGGSSIWVFLRDKGQGRRGGKW